MPELEFRLERAECVTASASPGVNLRLIVASVPAGVAIQSAILRVQVRIEATQRRYTPEEEERLRELFGGPSLWGRTLKSLLWANVTVNVPGFTGETTVDLPLPCTFDFDVAAAKYLYGLQEGEVPLRLLFSGTVFHAGADGALQVSPIPWSREVVGGLPISVWRDAIEGHYPGTAVLRLERAVFERLYRYRREHGLATWDAAVDELLAAAPDGRAR